MSIALCICTYKRPQGLRTLLDALTKLDPASSLDIVVADNHHNLDGVAVCEALPASYPYPVKSVAVSTNGISFARNAAIERALALSPEFIAFLDDDEWPEPQWLSELLRIQNATDADVVGGPTLSVFPDGVPATLKSNPYFGADLNQSDGARCQLEAAGNFLIRTDILKELGPDFFNPEFAHSGGEDLAFFTELAQRDARMHWAAKARVSESVPENRLTQQWLRTRVVNIANSRVRVMQLLQPDMTSALIRSVKTAGLGIVAGLLTVGGMAHPPTREKANLLRWKFLGKFKAHMRIKTVRGEGH